MSNAHRHKIWLLFFPVSLSTADRTVRLGLLAMITFVSAAVVSRLLHAPTHMTPPGHVTIWVQLHLATILPSILLGLYLLSQTKGTPQHRLLGKIWCGLMVATALFALMIRGYFMPNWHGINFIHLFSLLTLISVPRIIMSARKHQRIEHQKAVFGLCFGGLFLAGLFTFLPGRLMGVWLFGH